MLNFFAASNLTDPSMQLSFAVTTLDGAAKTCWVAHCKRTTSLDGQPAFDRITSFHSLVSDLLTPEFVSANYRRMSRDDRRDLARFEQGNRSASTYVAHFCTAAAWTSTICLTRSAWTALSAASTPPCVGSLHATHQGIFMEQCHTSSGWNQRTSQYATLARSTLTTLVLPHTLTLPWISATSCSAAQGASADSKLSDSLHSDQLSLSLPDNQHASTTSLRQLPDTQPPAHAPATLS